MSPMKFLLAALVAFLAGAVLALAAGANPADSAVRLVDALTTEEVTR